MITVRLSGLLIVFAALFVNGCVTAPGKPKLREEVRLILQEYTIQSYDECLVQIDRVTKKKLNNFERATVLMAKGCCLEEKGAKVQADAIYNHVSVEFAQTSFADAAQRRLKRQDGDQKEHLELDFENEQWMRSRKNWSQTDVIVAFIPKGELSRPASAVVLLGSIDRLDKINSPKDVIQRMAAQTALGGGKLEFDPIELSPTEGIWAAHERNSKGRVTFVGISRVMITASRGHVVAYGLRKPALSQEDKEKCMARVMKAKITEIPLPLRFP